MQRGDEKVGYGKKKDRLPCSICKWVLARVQSIQYVKVCHKVDFVCVCPRVCLHVWDGIDAYISMMVHIFPSWQLVHRLLMLILPKK